MGFHNEPFRNLSGDRYRRTLPQTTPEQSTLIRRKPRSKRSSESQIVSFPMEVKQCRKRNILSLIHYASRNKSERRDHRCATNHMISLQRCRDARDHATEIRYAGQARQAENLEADPLRIEARIGGNDENNGEASTDADENINRKGCVSQKPAQLAGRTSGPRPNEVGCGK
jgi:hypothetical protein